MATISGHYGPGRSSYAPSTPSAALVADAGRQPAPDVLQTFASQQWRGREFTLYQVQDPRSGDWQVRIRTAHPEARVESDLLVGIYNRRVGEADFGRDRPLLGKLAAAEKQLNGAGNVRQTPAPPGRSAPQSLWDAAVGGVANVVAGIPKLAGEVVEGGGRAVPSLIGDLAALGELGYAGVTGQKPSKDGFNNVVRNERRQQFNEGRVVNGVIGNAERGVARSLGADPDSAGYKVGSVVVPLLVPFLLKGAGGAGGAQAGSLPRGLDPDFVSNVEQGIARAPAGQVIDTVERMPQDALDQVRVRTPGVRDAMVRRLQQRLAEAPDDMAARNALEKLGAPAETPSAAEPTPAPERPSFDGPQLARRIQSFALRLEGGAPGISTDMAAAQQQAFRFNRANAGVKQVVIPAAYTDPASFQTVTVALTYQLTPATIASKLGSLMRDIDGSRSFRVPAKSVDDLLSQAGLSRKGLAQAADVSRPPRVNDPRTFQSGHPSPSTAMRSPITGDADPPRITPLNRTPAPGKPPGSTVVSSRTGQPGAGSGTKLEAVERPSPDPQSGTPLSQREALDRSHAPGTGRRVLVTPPGPPGGFVQDAQLDPIRRLASPGQLFTPEPGRIGIGWPATLPSTTPGPSLPGSTQPVPGTPPRFTTILPGVSLLPNGTPIPSLVPPPQFPAPNLPEPQPGLGLPPVPQGAAGFAPPSGQPSSATGSVEAEQPPRSRAGVDLSQQPIGPYRIPPAQAQANTLAQAGARESLSRSLPPGITVQTFPPGSNLRAWAVASNIKGQGGTALMAVTPTSHGDVPVVLSGAPPDMALLRQQVLTGQRRDLSLWSQNPATPDVSKGPLALTNNMVLPNMQDFTDAFGFITNRWRKQANSSAYPPFSLELLAAQPDPVVKPLPEVSRFVPSQDTRILNFVNAVLKNPLVRWALRQLGVSDAQISEMQLRVSNTSASRQVRAAIGLDKLFANLRQGTGAISGALLEGDAAGARGAVRAMLTRFGIESDLSDRPRGLYTDAVQSAKIAHILGSVSEVLGIPENEQTTFIEWSVSRNGPKGTNFLLHDPQTGKWSPNLAVDRDGSYVTLAPMVLKHFEQSQTAVTLPEWLGHSLGIVAKNLGGLYLSLDVRNMKYLTNRGYEVIGKGTRLNKEQVLLLEEACDNLTFFSREGDPSDAQTLLARSFDVRGAWGRPGENADVHWSHQFAPSDPNAWQSGRVDLEAKANILANPLAEQFATVGGVRLPASILNGYNTVAAQHHGALGLITKFDYKLIPNQVGRIVDLDAGGAPVAEARVSSAWDGRPNGNALLRRVPEGRGEAVRSVLVPSPAARAFGTATTWGKGADAAVLDVLRRADRVRLPGGPGQGAPDPGLAAAVDRAFLVFGRTSLKPGARITDEQRTALQGVVSRLLELGVKLPPRQ